MIETKRGTCIQNMYFPFYIYHLYSTAAANRVVIRSVTNRTVDGVHTRSAY